MENILECTHNAISEIISDPTTTYTTWKLYGKNHNHETVYHAYILFYSIIFYLYSTFINLINAVAIFIYCFYINTLKTIRGLLD